MPNYKVHFDFPSFTHQTLRRAQLLLRPSDLETQDSYLNPFIAGLEFLFRVLRFSPFRVIFSMIISHFLIQEFRFTAKAERHQVLSLS